jgi:hypothetical protein
MTNSSSAAFPTLWIISLVLLTVPAKYPERPRITPVFQ